LEHFIDLRLNIKAIKNRLHFPHCSVTLSVALLRALFSNYVTTTEYLWLSRVEKNQWLSEKRVFPDLSFVSGGIRGEKRHRGDEHAAAAPSSFINLLWRIIVCARMYMYELESERASFALLLRPKRLYVCCCYHHHARDHFS
jgi:hypothetical protein